MIDGTKPTGLKGAAVTEENPADGASLLRDAFAYIRRRGRFTKAQAQALEQLVSHYELRLEENLDENAHIAPPLGVEIGFGMGYELLDWAQQQPDWQLLGVELYQPGIGSMLSRLKKLELTNVRLVQRPAQELFADLPPGRVNEIRIFFPDPWPKKRHHKRRLIQPEFLQQMHQALAPDGRVRLATDWAEYGEWIVEHFAAFAGFEVELDVIRDAFAAAETADQNVRDTTKFEARGERLGHRIRDLIFHKI